MEEVAPGVSGPQPAEHDVAVEGAIGADAHLTSEHDLAQAVRRCGADRLGCLRHQLAPLRRGQRRFDRHPSRISDRSRLGLRLVRRCLISRADRGDPPGPVLCPAPDAGGHDKLGGSVGDEGQGSESDRTGSWDLDLVVHLDASERGGRVGDRRAARDASSSEAGAASLESHAVTAGRVEQVDVAIEATRASDERRTGHLLVRRVAVISWAMPADRRRRSTSTKPASASWPSM